MKHNVSNENGFTLLELLIALAIFSILAAVLTTFYQIQTRSFITNESVVNMQQNARAATHFIVSELRMAGFEPGINGETGAGIEDASSDMIHFTMDHSSDPADSDIPSTVPVNEAIIGNVVHAFGVPNGEIGQPGEEIVYMLDNGNLVRDDRHGSGEAILARNLDALNFVYYDDEGNRIPEASLPSRLNDIRSVLVTVLARSARGAPGLIFQHSDNQTYVNREGDELYPANDSYRRILLETEVRLRNM